jgi:class 3 adenylate cyclase
MPAQPEEPLMLEIAHVLFTDIVGYSRLLIDQQTLRLRRLQDIVRSTEAFRRAQAGGQLISLPTGDGMALVFFGDAVAPVRCALEISRALRSHPEIELRMGVHSGPVYRVADINMNQNVAGGGINMAQRVMDCGDAGHILVSKEVADVLRHVSDWSDKLHDLGEAEVKHGVRVRVFNLCAGELGNAAEPKKLRPERPAPEAPGLGPLVYKLCDRTSQENTFTNLFKTHLKQQPARPQTYFIHGPHGECHDSLVERLRDTRISLIAEKRWGAQRGVVTYKQPGWPHEGDLAEQQQDLRINLFKEFDPAYEGEDLSANALRRLEPLRLSPLVVVHHKIYADHWSARTHQLVEWYLGYWDEIKANTDGPQFLIFLSVIYPEEGAARGRARAWWKPWAAAAGFDKGRLRAELDELVGRGRQAGRPCFVLKELTPPKQFEVREWFSYYRIYDEQTQREKLAALFPAHVEQLSMSQVEHALKKIHAEFVSEKGYF